MVSPPRDGNNGFWKHFRPEEVATPEGFAQRPRHVQDWYAERWRFVRNAQPNLPTRRLPSWSGKCAGTRFSVLTQNVDGLHQAAGSRRVLELHGSIHRLRWPRRLRPCGGLVGGGRGVCGLPRPGAAPPGPRVVWRGADPDTFRLAEDAALHADVFIAIGTFGLVQPAARLQSLAYKVGALVVEVNWPRAL